MISRVKMVVTSTELLLVRIDIDLLQQRRLTWPSLFAVRLWRVKPCFFVKATLAQSYCRLCRT